MEIKVIGEYGYEQALLGLSLSYNAKTSPRVADVLAHKQGGPNKFLESMIVWLDIKAPLYWWKQFDTYRLCTKQSESTMHTILKQPLRPSSFEYPIPENLLDELNNAIKRRSFNQVINLLPSGFLQRRVVCVSYKTLQNVVYQRQDHKMHEWFEFIEALQGHLSYPHFVKRSWK